MLKFQSTKELTKLIRMIWDAQGTKSHKFSGHLQSKRFCYNAPHQGAAPITSIFDGFPKPHFRLPNSARRSNRRSAPTQSQLGAAKEHLKTEATTMQISLLAATRRQANRKNIRDAFVWPEPVADLELVDHGGHAHLVLLGEAVQVAQHALVHGRRRHGAST